MNRANSPPVPNPSTWPKATRPYARHKHNPAGTKLLRKFRELDVNILEKIKRDMLRKGLRV